MSTFEDRKKCLFDELTKAEQEHKLGRPVDQFPIGAAEMDRRTYRRLKGEMKQFRGQESIFKRPEAPLSRCFPRRNLPRHVKDPKKWVHYSLEDVSAEDMSDATNTATAYALIRELERQSKEQNSMICDDPESGKDKKPVFSISATLKMEESATEEKIFYRNNARIMPEYVVGKADKKIRKRPINKGSECKKKELKLDHLYDEDKE